MRVKLTNSGKIAGQRPRHPRSPRLLVRRCPDAGEEDGTLSQRETVVLFITVEPHEPLLSGRGEQSSL